MASVLFSNLSSSLFTFPPKDDPRTLPSPPAGSTLSAPPFTIPAGLFNAALDVRVPLTIATVYAVTVVYVNKYNKSRGNKPWAISKTKGFFWFVVVHNIILTVYSGWTFWGMLGALRRTVQHPTGPLGLTGTVDSLCKIHGIDGLGNAIAYNPSSSEWTSQSPWTVSLGASGTPDATDLGRLWNEGLAFYGWIFYLSKFYEVLDTVVILAKGKRSGTLQTYHHAGAMMCMWAGIRFMSPPIWMFCFVNSGIHTLMYAYYTVTRFPVRFPKALKRSLTVMQITQFVVGASYAAIHSFITYTVPVQVPNTTGSVTSVVSAASTAVSSVAASATASRYADLAKKLLFRAAGEEGLAENVNGHQYVPRVPKPVAAAEYQTEYQTVSCIDTSGQTFAIWLNVLYLAPLTFLFMRFFVKTYIIPSRNQKRVSAAKAGKDAIKGVERKLYENGSMNGKAGANGHSNPVIY